MLGLGSSQRKSTHGAPVESSKEGNHVLPAGVVPGKLQRALDGLRPGIPVVEAVRSGHGRNGREPLGKGHHVLVIKIGAGDVDQLGGLLLDGGDYFGMAVTGGNDGNAGGKVQELISVHIFNPHAAAALGHHGIGTGVAGGDVTFVTGDNCAGFRTRHRTHELRTVLGKKIATHLTIVLHSASLLSRRSYKGESIDRCGGTQGGRSQGRASAEES